MPIGKYPDFAACVADNKDKDNPEAFCAWLEHDTTGKWPSEHSMAEATAGKLRNLVNVPIFACGEWTDSGGHKEKFDTKKLAAMVKNFVSGAKLKLGHSKDAFNEKIAQALGVPLEMVTGEQGTGQGAVGLGKMSAIRMMGDTLYADFRDVPEKIVNLIQDGLYTSVSAELSTQQDGTYAVERVSLLGYQSPAVAVLDNRLKEARVYSFSKMEQPTVNDVHPVNEVIGTKKKKEANMPNDKDNATAVAEPGNNMAEPSQNVIGIIAEACGLQEGATIEQIVNAIAAMKSQSGPGGSARAATGPQMEELQGKIKEVTANFESADKKAKTLEAAVVELQKDKLIMSFETKKKDWLMFIKPEEMDKEIANLVALPEAQRNLIVATYDNTAKAIKDTKIFEQVGHSYAETANVAIHPFDVAVRKYASDNKVTWPFALLKMKETDGKGYEEFMQWAEHVDQFRTFNAMNKETQAYVAPK